MHGILLNRLRNTKLHLGNIGNGLRKEIVRAFLHRRHSKLDLTERRHKNRRQVWNDLFGLFDKCDPIIAGHFVVGNEKRNPRRFGKYFKSHFRIWSCETLV